MQPQPSNMYNIDRIRRQPQQHNTISTCLARAGGKEASSEAEGRLAAGVLAQKSRNCIWEGEGGRRPPPQKKNKCFG